MNADLHSQTAAYALDALPADEAERFEQHLTHCRRCRAEVASFSETTAELAVAVAAAPPPELRASVLRLVGQSPQVQARTPTPARRWSTRWELNFSSPLSWLPAAAVLLLVVAVGMLLTEQQRAGRLETQQRQLAAVLAAPDSVTARDSIDGTGNITVVASAQLDRAVVVAADLPQLDPDRTYQMWLIAEGKPRSAGTMPGAAGTRTVVLEGLAGAEALAVTLEPAGGSPRPTTPIIAAAELAGGDRVT